MKIPNSYQHRARQSLRTMLEARMIITPYNNHVGSVLRWPWLVGITKVVQDTVGIMVYQATHHGDDCNNPGAPPAKVTGDKRMNVTVNEPSLVFESFDGRHSQCWESPAFEGKTKKRIDETMKAYERVRMRQID